MQSSEKHEPCDERADDPNPRIANQAETETFQYNACKPTGRHRADQKKYQKP